ncbi:MAG TPA: LysM peptidoglycan-binding domain-containing protein, partial [Chitinophagales bacterium]|nr:LysM peptidoglycan-binding domain-containing protein [Chitinophagales bacterium]
MFKKIGFLFVSMIFVLILNAQNTEKATKVPQYVFHTVVFGETLNIIAFKYDVTTVEIQKANPSLIGTSLMPDQILRIPNKKKAKIEVNSASIPTVLDDKPKVKSLKYDLVTIEKGMTLYSISKKYNVDLEDLKKWNGLKTYDVKIGSQIVINPKNKGKAVVDQKPKDIVIEPSKKELIPKQQPTTLTPKSKEEIAKSQELKPKSPTNTIDEPVQKIDNQIEKEDIPCSEDNESQKELAKTFKFYKDVGKSITNTKGTGAPMTTSLGTVENTYFVMHRTLSIGTVIKVK